MTSSDVIAIGAPGEPFVTVGLPVFNGERFLARALDSLLAQNFPAFELIISDNASTDDTGRICEAYAQRDGRIRYYRQSTNIGAAPNHNFVVEMARGKYFKWAAHDDECEPQLLRRCVEVLEERPEVVLAYPQAVLIDQDGGVIGYYEVSVACHDPKPRVRLAHLLDSIGLGTPMYGVVRTETLRRTRLHGSFISADLVLLAEVALLGEIFQLPELLLRKRFHAGRSQAAHQTRGELLAWFNPMKRARRSPLPAGYQMTLEYLRGVRTLPLGAREKMACWWVVVHRRHRGRRLRRLMLRIAGREVADQRPSWPRGARLLSSESAPPCERPRA